MSSASFSMPDDGRQRVSLRRRATTAVTTTSAAADEALQHVLDRRLRKREGRLPPPSRMGLGSPAETVRESVSRLGLSQWLLRAAVLAGVALVLAAAVMTLARTGKTFHSVAGTMLVGKAPLARASISFHRANGEAGDPVTLTTGQDGGFRVPDEQPLPSGLYAIVVNCVAGGKTPGAAVIPAEYRDPTTTPLRVLVTENLSGLRLFVRR